MRLVLAATFCCSFVLSLALVLVMRRLSPGLGLVDHPGGRKEHARPTPLGGGIAILLAALLPLLGAGLLAWVYQGRPDGITSSAVLQENVRLAAGRLPLLLAILAGGVAFGALGTWDDLRDLSPGVKLAGQFVIALAISLLPQVRVSLFIHSAAAQVAITTVWIVLLVNCFNLLDNMDGQSGLMAFLCGGALLVVALQTGQNFIAGMLLALLGAVLGFLFFNLPPASIFMGDGGAMFIGYVLAVSTSLSNFLTARQVNPLFPVIVPLVIFAVPLYDTLSVIAIRLHTGRHIMKADRSHFAHRLLRLGMSAPMVLLTMGLTVVATAAGATLPYGSSMWRVCVPAVQTGAVVFVIMLLELASARLQKAPPQQPPAPHGRP
jgi:UDP-GlcNAc:undecaprenyl-phosphate GlcNAc-1-phosphate transferase